MNKIEKIIEDFLEEIKNDDNEIKLEKFDGNNYSLYNEFSFQFELWCFLREKWYKVEFERNIKDFNIKEEQIVKKEIDLVVYDNNSNKIAIELKFPRKKNWQIPEQMFNFVKDIKFIEQLKNTKNFIWGFFILLTDQNLFWENNNKTKNKYLYETFRKSDIIIKWTYKKPTWNSNKKIKFNFEYNTEWKIIWDWWKENVKWIFLKI